MAVLECAVSVQAGDGAPSVDAGHFSVAHHELFMALALAFAQGGNVANKRCQAKGLPRRICLVVEVSDATAADLGQLVDLNGVVSVAPEGEAKDAPHPRHHGYKDGFGK